MAKEISLPLNAVERLLKKSGGERIANDAASMLAKVLSSKAQELARESWKLAEHAGRKTVLSEDVRLARKNLSRVIEEL